MRSVTRSCVTCRQARPLRDFDLGGGQMSTTCLDCVASRARKEERLTRAGRAAKIAALEGQRRSLIAALVKIDAEIAALRARPMPPPVVFDDGEVVDTMFGEDDGDDSDRDLAADDVS